LKRSGIDAVLLEARSALCTLTTPASTGAFRLQFDNLEELTLVRESVELFLNFQEATGQDEYDLGVRRQGYLWATTSEVGASRQRDLVEAQHSWGLRDVELVPGDVARERWPHLGPNVIQARYRGGDGFLDPKQLTMGMATASGGRVVLSCAAVCFETDSQGLSGVVTQRGVISTRTAVIAAGPFSGELAGTAGVQLEVQMVQRQKVIMPEVDLVPSGAPMTIDDDTGAHWRPALRGAYLLFTDPATRPTPPSDRLPVDHRHALSILDPSSPSSVARITPFWRDVWARNAANWIVQPGQYVMTPDHRPLLGSTGIAGLYVNTGYSGHGIMGSAAGSRHLCDVVMGKLADEDNVFHPDRIFEARDLDIL
jgi:sarcosine oxidase subunit beta